jgi:hypothetical protein
MRRYEPPPRGVGAISLRRGKVGFLFSRKMLAHKDLRTENALLIYRKMFEF